MENTINEPQTAANILIAKINSDIINAKIYSEKATAYLEQNDKIFENLLVRDIVKVKKINGKCVVRMNSKKRATNYL